MDLRRTSAPLTKTAKLGVVTVADVKAQARVVHSDEDGLIEGYVEAGFDYLHGPEGWLNGYCLLEETFEAYLPRAADEFELPLRPIANFTGFGFSSLAAAGTYEAIDAGLYGTSFRDAWGLVSRVGSTSYPLIGASRRAYKIAFKAGHASAAEVPTPLKQAIKLLAAHWYQNREATMPDSRVGAISRQVEYGVRALAGRYRVEPDHS